MASQEQNLYSLVFIILFVLSSILLISLTIRKIQRDKHRARYEYSLAIPTQKLCALVLMIPSFFEFLMNTYYHIILKSEDAIFWYSILDFLFLITTFFVYRGMRIQWLIFILQFVQVYTFAPSILNHINEGFSLPLLRFITAFIYYVISVCVILRVVYPFLFIKTNRITN